MKDLQKSCKIAVVQAAPVLFDKKPVWKRQWHSLKNVLKTMLN